MPRSPKASQNSWTINLKPSGSQHITAETLDVTANGALVFKNGGVVIYAFPSDAYKSVFKPLLMSAKRKR